MNEYYLARYSLNPCFSGLYSLTVLFENYCKTVCYNTVLTKL